MLVSVIIPTYNYEKYIGEALQSLITQTYQDWECIVVDDGSGDNTRQAVARYAAEDPRIKYIYQNNQGQSAARNNGLRHARGQYIQFLDADDLLESFKLARHVDFLEKHPDVDLVYGDARYFRTDSLNERYYSFNDPDEPWMPRISGAGVSLLNQFILHNIFPISSPLLRRKVVDFVGNFDANLAPVEDWDYWLRCAIVNVSMQYLESEGTLALIRIHSLSSTQNLRMRTYKHLLIRQKFNNILPTAELKQANAKLLDQTKYSWIAGECFYAVQNIKLGKFFEGTSGISKAMRMSPTMACQVAVNKISNVIKRNLKKNRSS